MTRPMRDFTHGELEWRPWITPVDLDAATDAQRTALKITPSNRAVGAYSLVLAHDPEALSERSPLYNGIMFGAKGLPRADRELGAVAASRINGCSYCASVHAKRFTELTKAPEVMERIQARWRRGRARSAPQGDPRLFGEADARSGRDRPGRRRAAARAGPRPTSRFSISPMRSRCSPGRTG